MPNQYYVYILTNQYHNVLYTGVTRDVFGRVSQHKSGKGGGFTNRYRVDQMVYFEAFEEIEAAIQREKQIKGGSRQAKLELIGQTNPEWKDLFLDMLEKDG